MIRSFYLRNEKEVEAIKNLLHQMRAGEQKPEAPIQVLEPIKNALKLPLCVENVLNGYGYPEKEDCTPDEQKILYNEKFMSLYQVYMKISDPAKREQIKTLIAEALSKGL